MTEEQRAHEDQGQVGAWLVVVANRLPFRRVGDDSGGAEWATSPGGLVSALAPVLRDRDGTWVGWPGTLDADGGDDVPVEHDGIRVRAVPLSAEEFDDFYVGFANGTLWPLYHDAIRAPVFKRPWWHAYVAVNRRFAEAAADAAGPGAAVWVQDYQLQLVPQMLRAMRPDLRIGFFLHIPFPPRELFLQLPWRGEILRGLLGADVVGFQVPGAATNFARLARQVVGAEGTDKAVEIDGRTVRVGAFPISVETSELARLAGEPDVQARAKQIRAELGDPRVVMLGVDRLDYTKGIDRRIRAVAELYDDGELTTPEHVMVQVAVPSREQDAHYQREREEIERLIGEANGTHARVGRPPIHYLHQSVSADELAALYTAADVMLVTPLRDGMNLVAKEYVASRIHDTGVLVLSEFAGAARELSGAVLVNPHDLDGLKEAILGAVAMPPAEARSRMRRMRRTVRRRDVHAWASDFLAALAGGA